MCTGFLVEPRPVALVSFWGYGDIAGDWYARPDEFYRQQPLVAETEARAAVGKTVIAEPAAGSRRDRFYLYCRQNGLWPARDLRSRTGRPTEGCSIGFARSRICRTSIRPRC